MADHRKRRARSAQAFKKPPKHKTFGTAKGVKTPGEPTAHQMYGTYRALKILQLLMQATEKFLLRLSPFVEGAFHREAGELLADIEQNMPIANAHISRMEGNADATFPHGNGKGMIEPTFHAEGGAS